MKKISLQPYPGEIWHCVSKKEYQKTHKKVFKKKDNIKGVSGRASGSFAKGTYLIWGKTHDTLLHEISHALLFLFEAVGIDPREANGEPFCYLLQHVVREITNKKE